ncbi:MAG: LPXTG cell wall anchor domain-containing protein [Oscillospiraceae bacterium]|nr:LPXTG cell wall anchor domain-containing protein [Oscillospiraceae bacterium]
MKKTVLSLVTAVLLIAAFTVPALAAGGDLVYEMTAKEVDAFIANPSAETEGLRAAGSPPFSKEGGGIKISGRTADWNALDIRAEVFADADKDYTIIVGFSADAEAEFAIRNTDSPYGVLASERGAKLTLTYKGKGSEFSGGGQRGVRLATVDPPTADFVVTSIKIYEGDPPAGAKTGDGAMIAFALAALALAGGATVFIARKVKA